jgi:hypothetical protein
MDILNVRIPKSSVLFGSYEFHLAGKMVSVHINMFGARGLNLKGRNETIDKQKQPNYKSEVFNPGDWPNFKIKEM